MNYLENLPDDLIWEIYRKLHKSYMFDLAEELEEFVEEWEWRKVNNLGDDFDEWNTEDTSDTEDSNSEYSYVSSN